MFETLQNHIANIAMIGILIIIVILFKIYKQKAIQKRRTELSVIEDPYDTDKQKESPQNVPTDDADNSPLQTNITESETDSGVALPEIPKRSVPVHGKISKDNFKAFEGARILLAEDNLINQKVILGLLDQSGIEVVVANDGQEALDILQKDNNFLIILMDAHMPRVDGFEATRAIRKDARYSAIPVVALSGDTAADDIRKMKEAGMSEHLEKPLKIDALYDILYSYFQPKSVDTTTQTSLEGAQLNIEEGLEVCGNDTNFYNEILSEFLTLYGDSDKKLTMLLQEGKYNEALQLLLDITGLSANIGADGLHDIAQKLRKQILDKTDTTQNTELLHAYKEALTRLKQEIQDYQTSK